MSSARDAAAYEIGSCLLRVDNVSLALGGRPILRDVNVQIHDLNRPGITTGQVVALLGPSGMGKTQLFRILAGLTKPDKGQVLLGETSLPVERGMVGVVAQHYPLFEHRRVLGNLLVAGRRAGMSREVAKKKAGEWLARFKLEDTAGHYPAQLSGGQRQRIAIAQQFMCSEHYLLLDEPFSGLDVVQVDNVTEMITELACAHTLNTIVVVTHDISAALAVADTMWLLGRERDALGKVIPGARVVGNYNLIERGLAWRKDIAHTPEFIALRQEIRARFPEL